jgi:PIN domain nuclease of toxin-antitoxin system
VIVLDTHAWLWWVSDPAKLGRAARREIGRATRIGVPAICHLEIAVGVALGHIALDRPTLDWLQDALALPGFEAVALTPAVAVKAAELPASFPGDAADRLIAASAMLHSAMLVTKDERIRAFDGVRCVW